MNPLLLFMLDSIRFFLYVWLLANIVTLWCILYIFRRSRQVNRVSVASTLSLSLALMLVIEGEQLRLGKPFDWMWTPISILLAITLTLSNQRAFRIAWHIWTANEGRVISDQDLEEYTYAQSKSKIDKN